MGTGLLLLNSAKLMRGLAVCMAACLTFSASAEGLKLFAFEGSELLQSNLEHFARKPKSRFTERPTAQYVGARPGRDETGRGGVWTPKLLQDLKRTRVQESVESPIALADIFLSLIPLSIPVLTDDGEPGGGDLPGEGTGEGGSRGNLNTNTGNRHVKYDIVSWGARGQNGVSFNLHHNSKGAYSFDLGKGWSHSYDIKITHTVGSSAIIRYGTGLEVPYTDSSGVFAAPAGFHDDLVKHSGGTWTITTKEKWLLGFNTAGRLISVEDRNGNVTTVTRDSSQKITSIADGAGRSLLFSYTSGGLIEEIEDPSGRHWFLDYDTSNHMTDLGYPQVTPADIVRYRSFTYDGASNIITETDRRNKVWTYGYDTTERLTSFTNPLSQTYTWAYTTSSVTFTQPNSETVVHNYSSGLVASEVDQAGFSHSFVYDSDRNVTSYTDKRGKVWTATYDTNGNALTETNPLSKTWTYTYNSFGKVLTATDPLSNVDTYTYDSNGNLLTSVDALSRTQVTVTYNSYGEPATATDAMSRVSTVSYNSQGDITQLDLPGSVSRYATYDVLGRTLTSTDPAGNTTDLIYDGWGRLIEIEEPGSAISQIDYDLENNLIGAEDPLGRDSSRIVDAIGQVTSSTNAENETTSFTYNSVGYLTGVTNARGYSRTYTYTDRGEVATLTLADGAVEEWFYDGNGNTTGYTNPLGQTILYTFDNASQQTGVDYPTGLADTSFSYDNAGRTTQMVDATGTSSWTLNAASEVTGLTTPQGSQSYTYNLAGQVTAMTDVGVGTTSTTYDSAGRPSLVTDAFGDDTGYTYDSAGRLHRKDNENGTYELYSYDNRNRVTTIITKNGLNTVIGGRSYTFDAASQVTSVSEGAIQTGYVYDDIGQLLSETKIDTISETQIYQGTYTYDANGNRLTRTVGGVTESYSYDNADKLTAITGGSDARTFGYDAAGRTTSVVRSSGTTTVAYDFESRITSVSRSGMTTNSYTYNGLDARVGAVDSGGTRAFRRAGVGATSSVLGDGFADYTPGGEVRGGVKKTSHGGMKNQDMQTSSTGSIAASKMFDAFGIVVSGSGSWSGPYGYGGDYGYQGDVDTGWRLLGHRYYDSDTGRFLTRDPIKDGRNWYSYCNGNPISLYDNDGLTPKQAAEVSALADIAAIEAGGGQAGALAARQVAYEAWLKMWAWYFRLPPIVQQFLTSIGIGPWAKGGGWITVSRTMGQKEISNMRATGFVQVSNSAAQAGRSVSYATKPGNPYTGMPGINVTFEVPRNSVHIISDDMYHIMGQMDKYLKHMPPNVAKDAPWVNMPPFQNLKIPVIREF